MKTAKSNKMKIAILGHRGVTVNYGGFETFAQELGPRLVKKGYRVTSYDRLYSGTQKRRQTFKGVRVTYLPSIKNKFLDTITHTLFATIDVLYKRYDAVIVLNVGNAPFAALIRLFGMPVLFNVDGLEWKRRKWGIFAKSYLRFCSWLAPKIATQLITDAKVVQDYYKDKYNADSVMIPYGGYPIRVKITDLEKDLGVRPNEYFLYVSRFEPENNPDLVVKAFEQTKSGFKLVMVGGSTYSKKFEEDIRSTNDPRIIFPGFVYGKDYKKLQQNAYAYLHSRDVGGTNPTFVEAMGYGNCILANDNKFSREVGGDSALYYKLSKHNISDLAKKIDYVAAHPEVVQKMRKKAQKRMLEKYSWDTVVKQYSELISDSVGSKSGIKTSPVSRTA